MQKVWQPAKYVKCLHPGWHIVSGIEEVMESWRLIFRSTSSMYFQLGDVQAVVLGRVGIVTLQEILTTTNYPAEVPTRAVLAATNIFELSDDGWKMILHHAGPTAQSEELFEDDEDEPNQLR